MDTTETAAAQKRRRKKEYLIRLALTRGEHAALAARASANGRSKAAEAKRLVIAGMQDGLAPEVRA